MLVQLLLNLTFAWESVKFMYFLQSYLRKNNMIFYGTSYCIILRHLMVWCVQYHMTNSVGNNKTSIIHEQMSNLRAIYLSKNIFTLPKNEKSLFSHSTKWRKLMHLLSLKISPKWQRQTLFCFDPFYFFISQFNHSHHFILLVKLPNKKKKTCDTRHVSLWVLSASWYVWTFKEVSKNMRWRCGIWDIDFQI